MSASIIQFLIIAGMLVVVCILFGMVLGWRVQPPGQRGGGKNIPDGGKQERIAGSKRRNRSRPQIT